MCVKPHYKSFRELVDKNIEKRDDVFLQKGDEIFEMVRKGAEVFYPNFSRWFHNMNLWSIYMQKPHRDIIYAEDKNGNLLGAAATMHNEEIKRISLLYVAEHARGQGLAKGLIKECISVLGTDKPGFSLREQNLASFDNIIKRFKWEEVERGPELVIKRGPLKGLKTREVYFNQPPIDNDKTK